VNIWINIIKEKRTVNNRDNSIRYSEVLNTAKKDSEAIKTKDRKLKKLLLILSSKDDFEKNR
jgi:hypothetical protein